MSNTKEWTETNQCQFMYIINLCRTHFSVQLFSKYLLLVVLCYTFYSRGEESFCVCQTCHGPIGFALYFVQGGGGADMKKSKTFFLGPYRYLKPLSPLRPFDMQRSAHVNNIFYTKTVLW